MEGSNELKFRTGAVALLDTLGFKGIWEQHSIDEVYGAFEFIRNGMLTTRISLEEVIENDPPPPDVQTVLDFRLLSDTLVISCYEEFPKHENFACQSEMKQAHALAFVCGATKAALMYGAVYPIPFAFRGAISTGNFFIKDDFLIGPAIDDAARYSSKWQGAFVAFTPSTMEFTSTLNAVEKKLHFELFAKLQGDKGRLNVPLQTLPEIDLQMYSSFVTPSYPVPQKKGEPLVCHTMNPVRLDPVDNQFLSARHVFEGIKRSFARNKDDADVQAKWAHTYSYLRGALELEDRENWQDWAKSTF